MKYYLNYLLLTIFVLSFAYTTQVLGKYNYSTNPYYEDFEKTYEGKINNKHEVVLTIKQEGNTIKGYYFYTKRGIDIRVVGNVTDENKFTLYELDHLNNKVAKISGILNDKVCYGTWENLITKKILSINLTKINVDIEPLPKYLEGIYRYKQREDEKTECDLTIEITKKKGEFYYKLRTTNATKTGKIFFYRSLDEKLNYIYFEGLKNDSDKENIHGLLSENEILIQNTGNSMNDYTRLLECDIKYIVLTKNN